jgi:asparagine synthase (glutamine-hydrolysing)
MLTDLTFPSDPLLCLTRRADQIAVDGPASASFGIPLAPGREGRANGGHAQWQFAAGTLRAATDRHGLFPLFYHATTDRICISPSLESVVRRCGLRQLDADALAVFVHVGMFLNDLTPFKDVRVIPPGGTIEWDGTLRVTSHRPRATLHDIPRPDAAREVCRLFHAAVARCAEAQQKSTWISLTGGRDSRAMLYALLDLGVLDIQTYTITSSLVKPADTETAARVANLVGVPHTPLGEGDPFVNELIKNRRAHFMAEEGGWYAPSLELLAGKDAALYDGVGGDVLISAYFQNEHRLRCAEEGRTSDLIDTFVARRGDPIRRRLPALFPPDVTSVAHRLMCDAFEPFAGEPNAVTAFLLYHRTCRCVSLQSGGTLRGICQPMYPFLDHDLYDFCLSLPPRMLIDRKMRDNLLADGYPRRPQIPFAGKAHRRHLPSPKHARFVARAVKFARQSRDMTDAVPGILRDWFRALLSPNFRANNKYVSPLRLIYYTQLTRLAAGESTVPSM